MEPEISEAPYPGLRTFTRNEDDIFFGRDDHVDAMLEKLGQSHFLCVTGPSGCGKSSLARTGLFNALEAGFLPGYGSDWVICDFSPGRQPIQSLSEGLANGIVVGDVQATKTEAQENEIDELSAYFCNHVDNVSNDLNPAVEKVSALGDRPVIILVDQFEDLFRYAQRDPHEAARFVGVLLETAQAARRIFVVITVRTEELAKCARYPGLTAAVNQSQFLTPTLDRYQLQEAIELFGSGIDEALTVWMLNDLERELDKLPLMQHALKILYDRKEREDPGATHQIKTKDYVKEFGLDRGADQMLGGQSALRDAMSNRLDKLYHQLHNDLRPAAKKAFCALTNVASQGRDIRNPLKLSELAQVINLPKPQTRQLVRAFAGGDIGYLRSDGDLDGPEDPWIDVSHECVLRLWRKLQKEWLPEEQTNAQQFKELARRTWSRQKWLSAAKGWWKRLLDDRLLRGSELKQYSSWWRLAQPNAAWADRYLHDVTREIVPNGLGEQYDGKLEFDRVDTFVKKSRRSDATRKFVLFGFTIVLIGVFAFWISYQQRQERIAQAQQERGKLLTALASINPNELDPKPLSTIRSAVELSDNQLGWDLTAKLWKSNFYAYERQRFSHQPGAKRRVRAAGFAASGELAVTLTDEPILRAWSVDDTTQPVFEFDILPHLTFQTDKKGNPVQRGRSMRVAPDDNTIAIGTQRGTIALVDLKSEAVRELHSGPEPWDGPSSILDLAFSADGMVLAAASLDKVVRLWRLGPGGDLDAWVELPSEGFPSGVWSVGLNNDGNLLVAGLGDGRVCLVDLTVHSNICDGSGHEANEAVKAVRFRPDSEYFVSAGNDDRAVIWTSFLQADDIRARIPVSTGQNLWHDSDIWDVTFDKKGLLLATISWDGDIRLFDARNWKPLALFRGHNGAPRTLVFDPTAQYLLSAALDNTARIWTPFAPLAMDELYSYRFDTLDHNEEPRDVQSLTFGPSANWVAFTDTHEVFSKPAQGAPQLLPIPKGGAHGPEFSELDVNGTGVVAATLVQPEIWLWARSESQDRWNPEHISLAETRYPANMKRRAVALSRNGQKLAVGLRSVDGYAVLLCPITPAGNNVECSLGAKGVNLIPLHKVTDGSVSGDCRRQPEWPNELALSDDASVLAICGRDCAIRLYDLTGPDPVEMPLLIGDKGAITSLQFSPDNTRLLSGSADHTARVWNLATGKSVHLTKTHVSTIAAARFSPTGQTVATVSNDEKLVIWDAETGEPRAILPGHQSSIRALDVATDAEGRALLVTGTASGEIKVMPFFEDIQPLSTFSLDNLERILGGVAPTDLDVADRAAELSSHKE